MDAYFRWRAIAKLQRLMLHFETYIQEEQSGSLKGRQISDNAVMLAVEQIRTVETGEVIIAFDQEKGI